MIIDVIFALLLLLAVIKGYQKGFIVAVFSMIAFIIGLAAAIKLSAVAAGYVGDTVKVSDKWLPIISFILVFIVVVILIRLGAKFIERMLSLAMLGWLNRLIGILLYVFIYIFIYSILLFYASQIQLLTPETIEASASYKYIQPLGPKVIDAFGKVIPVFKNMFAELEIFFTSVSEKMKHL